MYLSKIEPILKSEDSLNINDISIHAKIKLLFDLQLKILKNVSKVEQPTNINLHQIETTMDNICGFLSTLNYFNK